MKIKQQKQIKDFLIEEFGIDKGNIVFSKQEEILNEIIKNVKSTMFLFPLQQYIS